MIQLTKYAIRQPITVVMCLLTVIYFGFQSVMGARLELTPEMELPMLLISTVYAGASPDSIEELITNKQEDAISSLSNVDTVQSYSMDNVSIVMVQYDYGTNIDTAYINLKKAIDGIRGEMPEDAEESTIMELDINASPVITMAVNGDVDENLYTYTKNKLVPEFEKLGSVGEVSLSGGQKDYVRVELNPEKLEQYHLTMAQVAQLVGAADFTIPAGQVDVADLGLNVTVGNDFDTVESLKTISLPVSDGNIIHLSDVAQVYQASEEADSIGRYNGQDIISLEIKKQQSSTAIEVSKQVKAEIEKLERENPALHFEIIDDSSEMISESIGDVFQTVIFAVLLAMLVLWLFCGDLRASVIIGASILTAVVLALISISAMGYSLNVISLTSLVFGVGMMVDNSINVLDGCFRAKERLNYYDAAVEGTRSMIGAIAGGTATNCVVFVPLLIMSGLTGQLFKQLAATIIFCLTASLFSAVTIVPLCFYKWHPQENEHAPVNSIIKGLQRWYREHMPAIVPKTRRVFLITLALLAISAFMASQLRTELMPMGDQGIVAVTIKTKPGLKIDGVNKAVAQVENLAASDGDVDYYLLTYGGSGLSLDNSVSLTAYLKDDSSRSTDEVIDDWQQETTGYENVTVSMERGSATMSSMSSGRQIEVDLQGTDYDALKAETERLVTELKKREDVTQVHSSIENAAPVLRVKVDPVKAQAEGLVPASVGSTVYQNLSGIKAATMRADEEDMDVRVEFAKERFNTAGKLSGMMITTASGTQAPLGSLADIYYEDSPQQIVRKDKVYQVSVTMEPVAGHTDSAETGVKSFVKDSWEFQNGVKSAANAMDESMGEELGALGGALVTAIFLIFVAMSIQFASAKYSLMIMITIPFSLLGAFGFLYIADSPISMTSMLGFLMMVGNVVNAGILYVETVNQFRSEMPLEEALVEAGAIRLRPILMTISITIISELPNVFAYGRSGTTMQGSSLVNVGGLLASTALMLLMLPTFYRFVARLGDKKMNEVMPD